MFSKGLTYLTLPKTLVNPLVLISTVLWPALPSCSLFPGFAVLSPWWQRYFLPYLSSRCWEAPCTVTAARGPKRLMHPGREKQPAVGLLMFKTSSPSIHPCSLASSLFFVSPSTPLRKKVQAIKSAQMVKHLLGAFQCGKERLNSSRVTMWGHFLGRGDRDLEKDKRR